MNEVSCRALDPFFNAVDRRHIPRHRLAQDLRYSLEHLENRHERIDWDAFCLFMANVRGIFDRAELTEIGAVGLKQPGFRSFALIGRTLFSASGFYRWMLTSGGMGNQLFSNMSPSFRELGPGRINLDLQVQPGYQPCPDFFHFASGGFQALPELVGLKRARVSMIWIERGARFEIEFDAADSKRARLLKRLTRGIDARATAKELNETIRELERRNVELDIAYQLGHRIWGERDITQLAAAVTESLIGPGRTQGARFRTHLFGGRIIETGDTGRVPSVSVDLPGSPSAGVLEVWTAGSDTDARRLLELLAPTIALAIDNAIAYRELEEYQAGLERLVDERTTELRQARDQLSRTVEQLRDAQSAREMFFGNISHEIRTPLSLILLAAGDIEKRAGHLLDERGREGLAVVTDATRKLVRLVDELLLLAAGQEDKLTIALEPIDLAALMGQVVAAWRPAAERAGLELSGRVPESLFVQVDPVALERVASNLMSNAVKYTTHGRIELELVDDATTGSIRLSVLDTGPGIAPELAGRLFGRFERGAGESRRTSGTGIGLALVKQLVEAHGGSVAAHARAQGGTEMRVELPRALALHDRAERAAVAPPRLRATHPTLAPSALAPGSVLTPEGPSAGTVLITEDEPRLAESIARLLAHRYTAIIAHDGITALELVKKHQPQLLITDVDMPGMSGIELATRFREATGDRLAPIVILSALVDLRTRVAGLEAGAVDYVAKPFDPTELVARVESHFRMRDLAMRLHRAEHLSALGIMTSGLAHELRNPANGIVNAIEPLTRLLPPELVTPETPAGQLLEVMAACAEQIGFLARQLLGFRDASTLELRAALLPDLVQRAVMLARRSLTGVELRTELGQIATVMCAPPLLVQVLANLVENAAHAAGHGGWVEVRASEAERAVAVEIADSGPGVPPELRERVFEPFFTTKPSGKGTGLGLAVARAIVHRHGGTLDIRVRGDHSVFVMELPRDKAPIRTANAV